MQRDTPVIVKHVTVKEGRYWETITVQKPDRLHFRRGPAPEVEMLLIGGEA